MSILSCLFAVLLFDESLSQICDNTIFCETFDGDLSLWSLDNLTIKPTVILSHPHCVIDPCLRMEGNGGHTSMIRYADTIINLGNNYKSVRIMFDMYVGDIELDGEAGNHIGNEYAGIQYSLDNGNNYIDGPIIHAHFDAAADIGENQLYSDLNVTIDNVGNIDNMVLRLVSFISSIHDEIFYDNIRVYGIPISTNDPTSLPTSIPTLSPSQSPSNVPTNMPSEAPSVTPTKTPSVTPGSPTVSPETKSPTAIPSMSPSVTPTNIPSQFPTFMPSKTPSISPSEGPSASPTVKPSLFPTIAPSQYPSKMPSIAPSILPTNNPSTFPSQEPSLSPTAPMNPISKSPIIQIIKNNILIIIIIGTIVSCLVCCLILYLLFKKCCHKNIRKDMNASIKASEHKVIGSPSLYSGVYTSSENDIKISKLNMKTITPQNPLNTGDELNDANLPQLIDMDDDLNKCVKHMDTSTIPNDNNNNINTADADKEPSNSNAASVALANDEENVSTGGNVI